MTLWELFTNHQHYWGVPHQADSEAHRIVQICYSCGKVREVRVLTPSDTFIDPRQNAA